MSDDVDVIAETLTSRPLTQTEEATLARVEQFVSHHDFAAQQRPRLALEILMAGVAAAVAVTLIVALTHPSLPTPSPAHHTPVPTATVNSQPSDTVTEPDARTDDSVTHHAATEPWPVC